MYGNRFADMWRDINITEVKACWAHELCAYSVEQVGMAVDGLRNNNFPPTLPEFLHLCEQARIARPRISKSPEMPVLMQISPEETEAARLRCFETAQRLRLVKTLKEAVGEQN